MLRKPLLLGGLVLASAMTRPALAVDLNAVENALRALQPITEQWDRDAAARREREAAEAYRAAEIDRQQKQQQEAQAAAASLTQQQARLQALTPPPEWANRLAFHRSLLTPLSMLPSHTFHTLATPAFSPDGNHAAYVNGQGMLMLRELASGAEKAIRAQIPQEAAYLRLLEFASNDTLLLRPSIDATELMDLQGQRLHYWAGFSYVDKTDLIVSGRRANQSGAHFCAFLSRYDTQGKLHYTIDFANQNATSCNGTYTDGDKPHEAITFDADNNEATYYQDGQRVSSFRIRAHLFKLLGDGYLDTATVSDDGSRITHQLWDARQGKELCELPTESNRNSELYTTGYQRIAGRIYASSTAAQLALPSCQLTPLPGTGRLMGGTPEQLVRLEKNSGQVTLIDPETLQVQNQFTAKEISATSRAWLRWKRAPSPDLLFLEAETTTTEAISQLHIYDTRNGTLLLSLPALLPLFDTRESRPFASQPLQRLVSRNAPQGPELITAWSLQALSRTSASPLQNLPNLLAKDKYESTADYRKRLATLSIPFSMQVEVLDYNADLAQFSTRWQGIPMVLPMPPAQARRLDGQQFITLNGQLQVLDENFLTLAQATASAPDGTRIPIAGATVTDEAAPSPKKRGGQK